LPHALTLLDRFETIEVDLEKTALLQNLVGYYLSAVGRYKEAEPLYRQALEISQRVLGEDHPDTATSYNNVAYNLHAQGRYEEAEPLYRQALEIMRATLPPTHPIIETVQTNLNILLAKKEQ
jgi:tetratricopeptide (TPR) repeat protein